MKKVLTTAVAAMLVFGVSTAQAHDAAAERTRWLSENLELTEEQQAEVHAIFAEEQEQREQMGAQAQEAREAAVMLEKALQEQSNAIRTTTRERLAGVLTEEQQTQMKDLRKGMKKRAMMRHGMRGDNMQRGKRGMERRAEMSRRMDRQREEQAEAPAAEE